MTYTITELRAFSPAAYINALHKFTWTLGDFDADMAKKLNSNEDWFGPVERGLLLALLSCADGHATTIAVYREVGASLTFNPAQKASFEALMKTVEGFEKTIDTSVEALKKIQSTW